MIAFEQIAAGTRFSFGSHRFSGEEIKRFAKAYDQQPFHTDEEAAKNSFLGGLCASGWHTSAIMMRLLVGHFAEDVQNAKPSDEIESALGPSLGIDDLKWLKPVFAGDEIAFAGHITGKRDSDSRPGWGIVSIETSGANQKGEPVFICTSHILVAKIETGRT